MDSALAGGQVNTLQYTYGRHSEAPVHPEDGRGPARRLARHQGARWHQRVRTDQTRRSGVVGREGSATRSAPPTCVNTSTELTGKLGVSESHGSCHSTGAADRTKGRRTMPDDTTRLQRL